MEGSGIPVQVMDQKQVDALADPASEGEMGMRVLDVFLVKVRKFKSDLIPHQCPKQSHQKKIGQADPEPVLHIILHIHILYLTDYKTLTVAIPQYTGKLRKTDPSF